MMQLKLAGLLTLNGYICSPGLPAHFREEINDAVTRKNSSFIVMWP